MNPPASRRCCELIPMCLTAFAYGLALARNGKAKEALEQILAETKISPDSPVAWIEVSRLELHQGAVDESLKAAQEGRPTFSAKTRMLTRYFAQAWEGAGKREQAVAERKFVTLRHGRHSDYRTAHGCSLRQCKRRSKDRDCAGERSTKLESAPCRNTRPANIPLQAPI